MIRLVLGLPLRALRLFVLVVRWTLGVLLLIALGFGVALFLGLGGQ